VAAVEDVVCALIMSVAAFLHVFIAESGYFLQLKLTALKNINRLKKIYIYL